MEYNITTSIGVVRVRGLKHREVRQLRFRERASSGDEDQVEALQDEVLRLVVGDDYDRLDDLVAYERMAVFAKIVDLTFMTEEQRKNWRWQWSSTVPEGSTAAPTAPSN